MDFSEPYGRIFATNTLNVYEHLFNFEDFMFFLDELMPQTEFKSLNLCILLNISGFFLTEFHTFQTKSLVHKSQLNLTKIKTFTI